MTMPITGSAEGHLPAPGSLGRADAPRPRGRHAAPEALRFPTDHGWEALSWEQAVSSPRPGRRPARARATQRGARRASPAPPAIEWILADLAVMCAGGATTTVYPSTDGEDVAYILADSGSRFVVRRGRRPGRQAARAPRPAPRRREGRSSSTAAAEADGDWVITLARPRTASVPAVPRRAPVRGRGRVAAIQPDHLATLIYTSGTTGRPKGVELTPACWTYEGAGVDAVEILRLDDLQYLWLPLSHSFGKVLLAAQLPDRLRHRRRRPGRQDRREPRRGPADVHGRRAAHLREGVRPGRSRLAERARAAPRRKIFSWAFGVGGKVAAARGRGPRARSALLRLQYAVADRLVFSKIRDRLGGRIRYFVSGSAALSPRHRRVVRRRRL